ncbi:MAG: glycosyltransferase [Acidobacteria bacterium]|nr:glycosyltransferase [Acidobacteriota bacterium]
MSRHIVVMVTTSYPRFPGDTIATFLEPVAHGVAARGHSVHVVAPWHPRLDRPSREGNVSFHFFKYAPLRRLNVFGYSGALRADTDLRLSAWLVAPLALVAGMRAARTVAVREGATILHGHWMVPGGTIASAVAGSIPVVVSLHGSDVYVAERHATVRCAGRATLRRASWITACSDDLRRRAIAIGAPADRFDVVPYGVDAGRFKPDPEARALVRGQLGISQATPMLFTAGRLVRKKGFEYLIDAVARLVPRWPDLRLVVAGGGDLESELRSRAAAGGLASHVRFAGVIPQQRIAMHLAAADVVVIPSVRDESGNVDGLPNTLMEALASGTPVVTTSAGGIQSIVVDGETALVAPERDAEGLAARIASVLEDPIRRGHLGLAARQAMLQQHGWDRVAKTFEEIYDRVTPA